MDLTLTPAEEKFRDECHAWLEAHVPRQWHDAAFREALSPAEELAFLKSWQRTLYEEAGSASPGPGNMADAGPPSWNRSSSTRR